MGYLESHHFRTIDLSIKDEGKFYTPDEKLLDLLRANGHTVCQVTVRGRFSSNQV